MSYMLSLLSPLILWVCLSHWHLHYKRKIGYEWATITVWSGLWLASIGYIDTDYIHYILLVHFVVSIIGAVYVVLDIMININFRGKQN